MSECDWIDTYIRPLVTDAGAVNLSDDVAVLAAGSQTIASMDSLVEGVHFLSDDPADSIGQKLVRVNVSDLRAKGALCGQALLSIAWPEGRSETDFANLMSGIGAAMFEFELGLIGGDLVRTSGPLVLTLTVTGTCAASGPVRRSGGKPGHRLWVSGQIGWGGIGLASARRGCTDAAARHYRTPEIASLEDANLVASHASASMDISDGLLLDLAQLADASACGAEIALEKVPLASASDNLVDVFAQVTAGDDYQLLLAVPPDRELPPGRFSEIGKLTDSAGISLIWHGKRVNAPERLGFEH